MLLKRISLPQFSKMAFISKLRTFLDPDHYCVLDKKIASLAPLAIRSNARRPLSRSLHTMSEGTVLNLHHYQRSPNKYYPQGYPPGPVRAIDDLRGDDYIRIPSKASAIGGCGCSSYTAMKAWMRRKNEYAPSADSSEQKGSGRRLSGSGRNARMACPFTATIATATKGITRPDLIGKTRRFTVI
jgi:hypothetical protein